MSKVLIDFGKCSFALRAMHHKSTTTLPIAQSLISSPSRLWFRPRSVFYFLPITCSLISSPLRLWFSSPLLALWFSPNCFFDFLPLRRPPPWLAIDAFVITVVCVRCPGPIFHSSASFAAFLMTKISFVKNIFASFATSCLAFYVLEELQHQQ